MAAGPDRSGHFGGRHKLVVWNIGCKCAVVLGILSWTGATQAQSFIAGCAAALIPTEVSDSNSLAVQYAYLSNALTKLEESG